MNIYIRKIQELSFNSKYILWYNNIISNRKNQFKNLKEAKRYLGYVERHHILPRCLCTTIEDINSRDNIVFLTAREHFICHWILSKCVVDVKSRNKMKSALAMFIRDSHGGRLISSYEYEVCRRACAESQSFRQKGKRRSKESIDKTIQTNIQRYGGGSSRKGADISKEQRDKMKSIRNNRPTYNEWFINADPEEKKRIHSEWGKKYSNFATNNPSSTPEGARLISLRKSKGIFITPFGTFNCMYDMKRHDVLSKIDLYNCPIFRNLDGIVKTRAINRANLPIEWKDKTWRQVGFDFISNL